MPPTLAAELVPYDPSIGELRVNYAGFFDPGFGYGLSDILGTKAVLDVRAHEVPVLIEDRQVIGRLLYSRMMGRQDKVYGISIGSSYQMDGSSHTNRGICNHRCLRSDFGRSETGDRPKKFACICGGNCRCGCGREKDR